MSLAGTSIVPPGHGPVGGVVPIFQKHVVVIEVFSAMLQLKTRPGLTSPLTVACSATWPFVEVAAVGGATVTVTLFGLNPLPEPQPAATINTPSDATNGARCRFI